VKEFKKSVNIWGSYGQEFSVLFFLTHSVHACCVEAEGALTSYRPTCCPAGRVLTLDLPMMSWTEDSVLAASQMLAMTTVERDLVMRERSGKYTTY